MKLGIQCNDTVSQSRGSPGLPSGGIRCNWLLLITLRCCTHRGRVDIFHAVIAPFTSTSNLQPFQEKAISSPEIKPNYDGGENFEEKG
ncbi:hypothetical protein CEXT_401161 [Caerostris extrusa]|uniref:Uncharacterized protein n=1 Tax=Caerostris extrusa TaxID=172846 RepID=A0AAV4PV65_CAEEX|nr:hypothetical protein CEXT_401161 [Caerostris extrusa]